MIYLNLLETRKHTRKKILKKKKTYKILTQLQFPGKSIAIFMVLSEIIS